MDLQTMIGKRRGYAGGKSYDFASRKKGQPGSMLQKFFIDQLKDIYWAEQHLIKALKAIIIIPNEECEEEREVRNLAEDIWKAFKSN